MTETPLEPSRDDEEDETSALERVVGTECPLCDGPLNALGDCEDVTCEACPDYEDDEEDEEEDEEDDDGDY